MSTRASILCAALALCVAQPASAEVPLHGFVQGNYALRTATPHCPAGFDCAVMQAEERLELNADLASGDGRVGALGRADFVHDALGDEARLDVRELSAGVNLGWFSARLGRQILTFVYIPVMIYLLNIPTRIVIGSTLGIVFLGAIAGTIGKMATGQIIWPAAIALVVGTVPGARFGGNMSKKIDARYLRIVIAVIIAVTGIKMWHQLATG